MTQRVGTHLPPRSARLLTLPPSLRLLATQTLLHSLRRCRQELRQKMSRSAACASAQFLVPSLCARGLRLGCVEHDERLCSSKRCDQGMKMFSQNFQVPCGVGHCLGLSCVRPSGTDGVGCGASTRRHPVWRAFCLNGLLAQGLIRRACAARSCLPSSHNRHQVTISPRAGLSTIASRPYLFTEKHASSPR